MKYVVDVEDLVKFFGKIRAVDGISFQVHEGEIFGLIGPNGAGKTTTLRILATLLIPTSGHARIYGYDVVEDAEKVRYIISYLPEDAGAYNRLTGWDYLQFMASFVAKNKKELEQMVKEGAELSGLGDRLRDLIKTYSKGMKRRLVLARALMVRPKVAILDEPTAGLDIIHAVHVRNIIREYARKYGITVVLSSHNMLEVEYICDRVAIINKGKIVAEGTPKELKEEYNAENLEEVFIRVIKNESPTSHN